MIDLERDGDVFVLRMQGGENRLDVGLLAELDGALVTGRRYPAPEAVTHGIVHEAVPEDAVLPRAVGMARALAGKDRATLGALKRGLFGSALKALTSVSS